MKKLLILLSALSLFSFASCKKEVEFEEVIPTKCDEHTCIRVAPMDGKIYVNYEQHPLNNYTTRIFYNDKYIDESAKAGEHTVYIENLTNGTEYTVTVKSIYSKKQNAFSFGSSPVTVKPLKNGPGTIVYEDGSICSFEDAMDGKVNLSKKPVGVIASAPDSNNEVSIVGLKQQQFDEAVWCTTNASAYNYVEGLKRRLPGQTYNMVNSYSSYSPKDSKIVYENSIDFMQKRYTDNFTAQNYPAWYHAINYAQENNITDSKFTDYWFIPSIDEFDDIYNNSYFIQEAIKKCNGTPISFNYNYYYITCNQCNTNSSSTKNSKIIFSFSFYSGQCAQSKYKNNNDFQDGSAPKCLFIHRFKMN